MLFATGSVRSPEAERKVKWDTLRKNNHTVLPSPPCYFQDLGYNACTCAQATRSRTWTTKLANGIQAPYGQKRCHGKNTTYHILWGKHAGRLLACAQKLLCVCQACMCPPQLVKSEGGEQHQGFVRGAVFLYLSLICGINFKTKIRNHFCKYYSVICSSYTLLQ